MKNNDLRIIYILYHIFELIFRVPGMILGFKLSMDIGITIGYQLYLLDNIYRYDI